MKKIILLLAVCFLMGCAKYDGKISKPEKYEDLGGSEIWITTIDGCEYFIMFGPGSGITHKGNCSNPIHFLQELRLITSK